MILFWSDLVWEDPMGARGLPIRDDVPPTELRRLARREPDPAAGGSVEEVELYDEFQAAALKFIDFMTSASSQATIAQKNSTLPTRDDAYTAEVKADPGIAGYQTVLASAQPRPALPEYSSLLTPLDTELNSIAGGKESLDKGLSNVEVSIAKLVPDFSK